MSTFIQLGATRDGHDPYLHVAHTLGMQAVLIETPDYIRFHRALRRHEFDQILAVEHPANEEEVLYALQLLAEEPTLILAGFERYIFSAYMVAQRMGIQPAPPGNTFLPPDKAQQRQTISHTNDQILQPRYHILNGTDVDAEQLAHLTYPIVIKPIDGGGGLGVFLSRNFQEVEMALNELRTTFNYDGGAFTGIVIEEYIHGDEYSVQGIARQGKCTLLTFCKKFIVRGTQGDEAIRGFREAGHIALPADQADPAIEQFAQSCISALGYTNGPFHIDMVQTPAGYYLIEINFRLSGGGLVNLMERVCGYNWAEEAFAAHLDRPILRKRQPVSASSPCAGQLTVVTMDEIRMADELQASGHAIEVQRFEEPEALPLTSRLATEMRHLGFTGRIIASAQNASEVEHLLRTCSPERAQQKVV
ncbi:MAG TPA: ATP-grasp domain-containing protein [Ktedonobacteraceae bacterium]|nr:ATP-grasp domain-containing protein [Ktedonobacteraceae bacterium]